MSDGNQHEDVTQSLAMQVSNAMVRAQKEYFGRGPNEAKSYFVDDLLFIVMRGNQTRAERTMVEDFGQEDKVREFRQVFENEMAGRLHKMIEELTGRKVLTYQSQILFNPDIVIEMFVFDQPLTTDGAAQGSADDELALDEPASGPPPDWAPAPDSAASAPGVVSRGSSPSRRPRR